MVKITLGCSVRGCGAEIETTVEDLSGVLMEAARTNLFIRSKAAGWKDGMCRACSLEPEVELEDVAPVSYRRQEWSNTY